MPRLVILESAKRDLGDIAERIATDSMSPETADHFIDKVIGHLHKLAASPILMGRARPELRPTYRSVPFGNYIIFLTYDTEGVGPRDVLKIIHVLWGARDLDAYFATADNDDTNDGT